MKILKGALRTPVRAFEDTVNMFTAVPGPPFRVGDSRKQPYFSTPYPMSRHFPPIRRETATR